jgi:3'-phosphoadenosine 5'-phosphosulfate (PAPS) 3'-phosphatase
LAECYFAAQGLGAWKSAAGVQTPLRVRPYDAAKPLRVVASRSHGADAMGARLDALPVPHVCTAIGSSLKFCRVAQGEADIYPRFGPTSQWDTAAAQCVLEIAGGCVVDLQGQSLAYGFARPLINPAFLAMGDRAVFAYFRLDEGDTAAAAGG